MNAELQGYRDAIQIVRTGRRALRRGDVVAAITCMCEAHRLRAWACGYAYGDSRQDDVPESRRRRVYAAILALQDDVTTAVGRERAISIHQERIANRGRHGHA